LQFDESGVDLAFGAGFQNLNPIPSHSPLVARFV
jgi:hypothetical protein